MNDVTARPGALKQVNLSLVRRAIKEDGELSRPEIASETGISSTTVRTLLCEMLASGEIESAGYGESTGGRRAERYRFRPDSYYGISFCILPDAVHCLLVDLCGGIVERGTLAAGGDNGRQAMADYLDELMTKRTIKAIGLGVSGVIENGGYLQGCADDSMLKDDVGAFLAERYHVPVVLENDMNATVLGFSRCYHKEYPAEGLENTNMAFLYFVERGISAGFIAGGRIIRGFAGYAGELGLIAPGGGKLLGERLGEAKDDAGYVALIAEIICWVAGVLNPQYVALGGPGYRRGCHGAVSNALPALLPDRMLPEILYSPDTLHDYFEGMAHLTAAKIFDEVQLVKEA